MTTLCTNRLAIRNEDSPAYGPGHEQGNHDALIADAIAAVRLRMQRPQSPDALTSPSQVKNLAVLKLGALPHEAFMVVFLNAQHQLLADEVMFRGTLTATSVYPREVVKAALMHNAAAVILAHNHPSGSVEPSRADEFLTTTLKTALALVDVRVLDHIVVGGVNTMSFVERGLL